MVDLCRADRDAGAAHAAALTQQLEDARARLGERGREVDQLTQLSLTGEATLRHYITHMQVHLGLKTHLHTDVYLSLSKHTTVQCGTGRDNITVWDTEHIMQSPNPQGWKGFAFLTLQALSRLVTRSKG